MADRLTVQEFLEFRKSLFKQSFRFVTQQSDEVAAVFSLDNLTDPSSRVTEEPVAENEADRVEEQECKAEFTGASESTSMKRGQKLQTLPRQRWTSVIRSSVVTTTCHMSVGSVDILPLMVVSGGGIICYVMACLIALMVMVPVTTYELILGQVYQGTAPRVYPMRHPRLSGMAIVVLICGLLAIPEVIHDLGSGVMYLRHCFTTPIPWALSDEDYRMCGVITDPEECRRRFKCTMFESLCVANPYKYAEHFYNRTVMNNPSEAWPPNPQEDWPHGWSFNWRLSLAGCGGFLALWMVVETGGKKVMEFLAIGGVGLDIFVLAMVMPFAINLEGAVAGVKSSLFNRTQWAAIITPREYLKVLGVLFNGGGLLNGVNTYVGSGFRIDHPGTRVMPMLIYAILLTHSLFMALVESSLAGSMDPQYRAKVKSTLVQQTGRDFMDLKAQQLPTTTMLQADLAPPTARHWGTIITPVMLASLYGATEWALLFFVAIVLRRGVRCVLLMRSLRGWVLDARHQQDKYRATLETPASSKLQWSIGTAVFTVMIASMLLFRHDTADGQALSSRLAAALAECAVPLGLTLLSFTDFWLLPPNGFAYDSLSATLLVILAFFTFVVATICACLSGSASLDKFYLNYISLALVFLTSVVPSTYLIVHYGRTFRDWWPFTQAITCSGRTEELRKKVNLIMGVSPPWKRLRKVTFSFALKCIVPFMALGAYVTCIVQWEKRSVHESWRKFDI